jgi:hypothetical protein
MDVLDENGGHTYMDVVSQSTKVEVTKSKVDLVIKLERAGRNKSGPANDMCECVKPLFLPLDESVV